MFNLDPIQMLYRLPAIIIGLSFHEFAHAYVSDRLGDPTPRSQGRLTLSPIPHIDIIGFILILVVGFGWAKPVQINPRHYKNLRRDEALVSIAGPLMNLLLAFVFTFIMKMLFLFGPQLNLSEKLGIIIYNIVDYCIFINIILFIFNLIPLPPLDGSHVLFSILPRRFYKIFHFLEQYGTIIFIIIVVTPIASYILSPISNYIYDNLMNLFRIGL